MLVKNNKRTLTSWLSLAAVVAVCVLLNVLGTKLNAALGLPLFLDNTGTILSALMGGYRPCITVGFLTNIIGGLSDSFTIYYCVISVFIAAAAVTFAEKRMLMRFPHVAISVVTFAFLGGVLGGALTWLINGFSFGEGFAVDFAATIEKVLPIGYFTTNLISCFLIDVVDKLVVTAAAALLYLAVPRRLNRFLRVQSWHKLTIFERSQKKVRGRISLRVKVTLLVAVSTTLVAATAIGVSIIQYHNATVEDYVVTASHAAELIEKKLDKSKLPDFIAQGRKAEGYRETEDMLSSVREAAGEIRFIYVYQIAEDGTHVVFDLDTEDVKAEQAGAVIPYDKTVTKYRDKLLQGEEIPYDISDDYYGWVLSVYRPLRDDSGKTLCYLGVDLPMNRLRAQEFAFLAKIISLFVGFLIVIRTYAVWMADRKIIRPINSIAEAAGKVAFDTPQARQDSMEMLEKLDVDTGDEIEHLYVAYKGATAETVRYIDEVQKKNEQIVKLQNGLVMVLADMVESRDKCTGDHVRKTAAYTEIILRQMQKEGIYADRLTEDFISEVVSSAPLHDVGKIAVSDTILNKPGKLTDGEFNTMKSHTTEGGKVIDRAMMLVDEESDYLTEARNLAVGHHEKWNGKGYPQGLEGENIPLSARVMAVADVFDALVSRRSYKEPFSIEKALDIIREGSGNHFDPNVVKAFLDAEDEVRRVAATNMDI